MILGVTHGNSANDAVILLLSMLTIVAQLFALVALVFKGLTLARIWTNSPWDRLAIWIGPLALPFAFAVALTATLGSLYFSEVIGWLPCNLCWYQRILIYPLVPILLLANLKRDIWIWPYVVLLNSLTILISGYHYLLEWYPQLETSVCGKSVPCTAVYLREFGYLSIPLMAGTAAASVLILMLLGRRVEQLYLSNSPSIQDGQA